MASINRRVTAAGEARYDVRVRVGGRVATKTFKRRQDADRWARLFEADRVLGAAVDPRAGAERLEQYAARWLKGRDLRPRTTELYADLLARYIFPSLGSLALTKLAPEAIRLWYSDLSRRVSPLQAAKSYRLLRSVLNTAVDDGLLIRNPCRIAGAGQERSAERPLVTPEQVLALADVIEPRYRALVVLAATGGLRLGELLALRRGDVDLAQGSVQISVQAVQLRDGTRLTTPPKTHAGIRAVALPTIATDALAEHVERFVAPSPSALLFTGPGGGPLRRATLYKSFWRARQDVGLPDATIHDLRHAGATLAAWTGASTKELMARLGHASPRAALRYQHAAATRDVEIARRLDLVFSAAREARAMEPDAYEAHADENLPDLGL
ncbi:MAG: Integrase, Lambda phage type [Actinomycetia bacterium]|nr:Integrase, Lambda phage type [Actinomycetes bacterium]